MINRDIPISPEVFFNGIIDHWDVSTTHDFVLRLAREWGYESFALDLGVALIKLAKEMEADQKLKELLEMTPVWKGASGEGQAPPACDDGWIPWNGGECPVKDYTPVFVRFRSGAENCDSDFAYLWRWSHVRDNSDIITYKVVD